MRIVLQPAFILHARPYRDSSLLLDIFTWSHGRIHAVARGARGTRSRYRGLLQPFVPLLISWSGNGELANLTQAEPNGLAYWLTSKSLLSGFYLNELLVRLLHRYDAHPKLYEAYQTTLMALSQQQSTELVLRRFELELLIELGYGLSLTHDAMSGAEIVAEKRYRFDPEMGFIACPQTIETSNQVFSGKMLLALRNGNLQAPDELRAAKRLLRQALGVLLGEKQLRSRELFA